MGFPARQRLFSTSLQRTLAFLLTLPFCQEAIAAGAAPSAATTRVDFARDIRPILTHHCAACHGFDRKARKAGLRLDLRESALARKAIVPGNPRASRLIKRINAMDDDDRMPPAETKKPLSDRQKHLLRLWIEQGAPYAQHWSFVAPRRIVPPSVKASTWPRNPIDSFLLARMEREGLRPSPGADRATLLRRVTLDLTGLPPTIQEIDAFLADRSPNAYEKVVDRLLSSPRYAERMAMAWLDAARYADTNGFNNDEDRTQWPWRDWVIDAFNRNLPYDRFIVDQLAGDLLHGAILSQKVATGFHRNQVHNTEGGIIAEEYRVEYVADRVHTTATVFLGLSMQCARCHDHKYDPISQKDFYRFFAFFNSVSDKQASYSNFVAAEPFLRVGSADQRERIARLEVQRRTREQQIHKHESEAVTAAARWEQGLTQADIRKLSAAGLLLHLPLDETKGDAVFTASGVRRGTVSGKPAWVAGKVGGALEFDGKTSVEVSDGPALASDAPFSISLWAYPTANGPMAFLSKMDDLGGNRGYDVLLEGGKVAVHLVHRWPADAIKVLTMNAVSLNAWHHIVVIWDGSRKAGGVKVFIDGKPQFLDVLNDTLKGTIHTNKGLLLGKRQTGIFYQGRLDDLRFYSLALSPEDAGRLAAGQQVHLAADLLRIPAGKRTAAQQAAVRRLYLEQGNKDYLRLKGELADVIRQKTEIEKNFPAVMVMQELPQPRPTFILERGQYDKPGEKVTPGVPGVLPQLPANAPTNRLGLANWLVSPTNPLTARVAVNRFWQMVFGIGLVKTVEDFGVTGGAPSHPELLDFLASEFVESKWDVKALMRLIVTSAAYRQSSRMTKEQRERDPENRLLARGARYRLAAETVRDNALAISGLLRARIGGPSVKPYQPAGLWEDVTVERRGRYVADKGDNLYRRSMYTFWKRTCPPPALMSFDAPNREVCVARRAVTNTPLQALVLLNDPTYIEAARHLAQRMLTEGGGTPEGTLAFGFRSATARAPSAAEQRILAKVREQALVRFRADRAAAQKLLAVGESPRDKTLDEIDLAAWTTVASVILNLDETISRR
jgi:hypothetical protein